MSIDSCDCINILVAYSCESWLSTSLYSLAITGGSSDGGEFFNQNLSFPTMVCERWEVRMTGA